MRSHASKRHEQCLVVAEYNNHGAMTLQSPHGKTYQVVGAESQHVARQLAGLTVDDVVGVSLRQAPGRGNMWRAVAVDTATSPVCHSPHR